MNKICPDCKKPIDSGPCEAHPTKEFLGYLKGEGLAYREAGQHTIIVDKFLTFEEVVADATEILRKELRRKK